MNDVHLLDHVLLHVFDPAQPLEEAGPGGSSGASFLPGHIVDEGHELADHREDLHDQPPDDGKTHRREDVDRKAYALYGRSPAQYFSSRRFAASARRKAERMTGPGTSLPT